MQQEIDKLIKKGVIAPLDFSPTGFYSRLFLVPKKGGLISPSHRLKSTKQVHSKQTFPDGKFDVHKASFKSKRVHGQPRPEGCLPNGYLTKVPLFHLARTSLSVSSPTIWAKHSTTNIYETVKTRGCVSSHSKYQTPHLPRRHTTPRVISKNLKRPHNFGNRFVTKPRVYNQFREVGIDTLSSPRIPRFLDKLEHNEILPASGKGIESMNSVQFSNEGEPNLLTPSVSVSGVSRVLLPSGLGSPTALQASTELLHQASCDEQWVLSGHSSPRHPSTAGASVVDHQHQRGEWESNIPPQRPK